MNVTSIRFRLGQFFTASVLLVLAISSQAATTFTATISAFSPGSPGVLDPDEARQTSDIIAFTLSLGIGVDWNSLNFDSVIVTVQGAGSTESVPTFGSDTFGVLTAIDTLSLGFGNTVIVNTIPSDKTFLFEFVKDASPSAQWQRVNLTTLRAKGDIGLAQPEIGPQYQEISPQVNLWGDAVTFDLLDFYDVATLKQYLTESNGVLGLFNSDDSVLYHVDLNVMTTPVPEGSTLAFLLVGIPLVALRTKKPYLRQDWTSVES